jgi:hypothetical protein
MLARFLALIPSLFILLMMPIGAVSADDLRSLVRKYKGVSDAEAKVSQMVERLADATGDVRNSDLDKDLVGELVKKCLEKGGKELDCTSSTPSWSFLRSLRWAPGSVLRFCFFDGRNEDRKHILSIFKPIIEKTNLRMDETIRVCDKRNGETAPIRIRFETGRSCFSYYGTEALRLAIMTPDKETMGLCKKYGPLGEADKGVVRHELLHALGVTHEHLRPECIADVKLEDLRNSNYFDNDRKKNAEIADVAIKEIRAVTEAIQSDYDPLSIMQYDLDAKYIKDGAKCSWRTVNSNLSKKDWDGLKEMYPK